MHKKKDRSEKSEWDLAKSNMIKHLELLRVSAGLTQQELGECVGVTRQTISALENQSRELTQSLFLALLYVFEKNPESQKLMKLLEIDEVHI